MIKLDYIKEFITLADTLSFVRTAELSNVTQPALTRHIVALEESLGGKLFLRDTRHVSLTPAGHAAYFSLKKMLCTYMAVQEQTSALSSGMKGILRISSPYYWTEDFTEPIIEYFAKNNPDAAIQIFSCQAQDGLQDLMTGRSDLFLYLRIAKVDSTIRFFPYRKERFSVCCLKDDPLAAYDSLELEQIGKRPITSVRIPEEHNKHLYFSSYNDFLIECLAKRNIYPEKILFTQQVDTIGLSLRKNGGVSILPYGIRHMDRSYLKFIPLKDKDCAVDMCFYYLMSNDNPLIPQFVYSANIVAQRFEMQKE